MCIDELWRESSVQKVEGVAWSLPIATRRNALVFCWAPWHVTWEFISEACHGDHSGCDSCILKIHRKHLGHTVDGSSQSSLQLLEFVFVRRITLWANHVLCILHSRSFKVASTNSGVNLPLVGGRCIALWVEHKLALVAKLRVPFWLPRVPSRKHLRISKTVLVISYNWWTMTLRAKHMLWALTVLMAHLWVPFSRRSCLITAWLPTMKVIVSS